MIGKREDVETKNGLPLVALMIKNVPAMQKTQVWSLGEEETLEKGTATYSSVLA